MRVGLADIQACECLIYMHLCLVDRKGLCLRSRCWNAFFWGMRGISYADRGGQECSARADMLKCELECGDKHAYAFKQIASQIQVVRASRGSSDISAHIAMLYLHCQPSRAHRRAEMHQALGRNIWVPTPARLSSCAVLLVYRHGREVRVARHGEQEPKSKDKKRGVERARQRWRTSKPITCRCPPQDRSMLARGRRDIVGAPAKGSLEHIKSECAKSQYQTHKRAGTEYARPPVHEDPAREPARVRKGTRERRQKSSQCSAGAEAAIEKGKGARSQKIPANLSEPFKKLSP